MWAMLQDVQLHKALYMVLAYHFFSANLKLLHAKTEYYLHHAKMFKCKNVDENGNAVNQSYRTEAVPNNERKEKKRRTKTNTDRNVIMSQNIEGHRGDKDIDSLIKFIESDGEGKSKQKTNYHTNGSINFSTRHRNNVKKEDSNTVPKAKREEEEKVTRSRIQSGKKERCTDKGSQLKKSNSLEEISKSKLEDLMVNDDSVKKPLGTVSVSLEFEQNKNHALPSEDEENENVKLFVNENEDNNLWWSKQENSSGKEFVDQNPNLALVGKKRREEKKKRENLPPRNEEILSTASIPLEEPDFYVVKKKQRKKKRRSSTGGQGRDSLFDDDTNMGRFTSTTNQYGTKDYQTRRGLVSNSSVFPPHDHNLNRNEGSMILYQYRHLRQRSPDHRRKSTSSMPPSDKSESSDLDSVHSLPVSSTTPKPALDQTSTSSGSTPQASYADIARMASVNIVPMNCSGRWPVVSSTKSTIPVSSTFTSAITSANLAQSPKINTGIPLGSSSKSNMVISQCSITPEESHVTNNLNHDSELLHNSLVDLTGSASFPLKFCGVRWLENAKCFQRALQIWDLVVKFLEEAKRPNTKPVETLKRAACDPFLKCKLAFCKTIADIKTNDSISF
uniref:Uncharacterized protein n=1 Tax=Timema douglasi TaxID=61478 RepID=A0A7R8VDZ0_TIMDO|nr:unnamed protein product [Timema douglasi]